MTNAMLRPVISAVLLAIPIVIMAFPSIRSWSEFRGKQKTSQPTRKTEYRFPFLQVLAFGYFCMWGFWVGGILSLALGSYDTLFGWLVFTTPYDLAIQIAGFCVFFVGALTYDMTLIVAGKYLRPSTSGIPGDHKLVRSGPFAVVRHPLYVSYFLITVGLAGVLHIGWILIPSLCIAFGIYPTAKAEEEVLVEQFGEEYIKYRQEVGMFLPKI
jgi:protein-S-isoprenylcysteine O-methyltransferase Ste14